MALYPFNFHRLVSLFYKLSDMYSFVFSLNSQETISLFAYLWNTPKKVKYFSCHISLWKISFCIGLCFWSQITASIPTVNKKKVPLNAKKNKQKNIFSLLRSNFISVWTFVPLIRWLQYSANSFSWTMKILLLNNFFRFPFMLNIKWDFLFEKKKEQKRAKKWSQRMKIKRKHWTRWNWYEDETCSREMFAIVLPRKWNWRKTKCWNGKRIHVSASLDDTQATSAFGFVYVSAIWTSISFVMQSKRALNRSFTYLLLCMSPSEL